jgi:hypothetical protein
MHYTKPSAGYHAPCLQGLALSALLVVPIVIAVAGLGSWRSVLAQDVETFPDLQTGTQVNRPC